MVHRPLAPETDLLRQWRCARATLLAGSDMMVLTICHRIYRPRERDYGYQSSNEKECVTACGRCLCVGVFVCGEGVGAVWGWG